MCPDLSQIQYQDNESGVQEAFRKLITENVLEHTTLTLIKEQNISVWEASSKRRSDLFLVDSENFEIFYKSKTPLPPTCIRVTFDTKASKAATKTKNCQKQVILQICDLLDANPWRVAGYGALLSPYYIEYYKVVPSEDGYNVFHCKEVSAQGKFPRLEYFLNLDEVLRSSELPKFQLVTDLQIIRSGKCGTAFTGMYDGRKVVIKYANGNPEAQIQLRLEAQNLCLLNEIPDIIKSGYFPSLILNMSSQVNPYIIMSFGGDPICSSSFCCRSYVNQLVEAVSLLHKYSFVHTDIHLSNVVVQEGHITLLDYHAMKKNRENVSYRPSSVPCLFGTACIQLDIYCIFCLIKNSVNFQQDPSQMKKFWEENEVTFEDYKYNEFTEILSQFFHLL